MSSSDADARRRLWQARGLAFVFYGASGFLYPYLGLFLQQVGLSGVQIGWLISLRAALMLVTAPLWGALADHTGRTRRTYQWALIGSALSTYYLGQQSSLAGVALGMALTSVFYGGAFALNDQVVVARLRGTGAGFGSARLGGSLGWTVVVIAAGVWIERTSIQTGFLGLTLGYLLTALYIAPFADLPPAPQRGGFARLLRASPPLRLLAAALLLFGVGWTWPRQFMALYAAELGGGEALVGLVSGVAAFAELPFMLWADRLVGRFRPSRVLQLSLALFGLTFILGAGVPAAGWLVPLGLINAAAFSLYAVGLINTLTRRVPREAAGTAYGFYAVTLPSLADLAGGPSMGWVFDGGGGRAVYALSGLLSLAGALMLLGLPRRGPAAAAEAQATPF
jgi:PPP family 3-phenylpropionic acid transporter